MTYISSAMTRDRKQVIVWERNQTTGERDMKYYRAPYYFFAHNEEGEYRDIYGKALERFDFTDPYAYRDSVESFKTGGDKLFESDINPEYKILSKEYYGKTIGKLNATFFDIEVDFDKTKGFAGPENPYAPINAVAFYHEHQKRFVVYAVPPTPEWRIEEIPVELRALGEIVLCKNEKVLLQHLLREIEDSDILSGWNSEGYDIPYVYERLKLVLGEPSARKLSFDLARAPTYKEVIDKNGMKKNVLKIYGRIHIDYMQLFFKFEPGVRDSYALESVAGEELEGMEKLHYEGSLADLYSGDFVHFLRYNLRDCEILKGFEDKKGFMALAVMLSHMDAAQVEDVIGTTRLTEISITNYCHYTLDQRVPDTNRDVDPNAKKFKGAFVIPPMVGLHWWAASIDVTSLYPSMMRAVNISPDTLMGQFLNNTDDFLCLKNKQHRMLTAQMIDGSFIELPANEWAEKLIENQWAISGFGTIFDQKKLGFIPALLAMWFTQRKEYKAKAGVQKKLAASLKEAGDPAWEAAYEQYQYFDKVQNIFKLKLNSTYGAFGNRFFKFYDVRVAESTTKSGQEVLFHMARTIGENLTGEHVFPNDAVIYGDTDSCYFKTYADDVDEALHCATIIAKRINKSFPKFCRDTFFCTPEFDDKVSVAQEIVARKSIFIQGKKGYMMHVLRDEGQVVDKIKITGLQIKKTTMPKPIREKLTTNFSEFIRDERTWAEVGLDMLEFKEKIYNSDDITWLGLPKTVKNLETYLQRMNDEEIGLAVPGHVRAAILWNKCLEDYQDKSSMKIVSGMKIRVLYLKKPIGKFKAIALPVDLDVIPDWFTEHFFKTIDKNAQLLRLVDKPLASMLFAIQERIPTRKGLLIDELFE